MPEEKSCGMVVLAHVIETAKRSASILSRFDSLRRTMPSPVLPATLPLAARLIGLRARSRYGSLSSDAKMVEQG